MIIRNDDVHFSTPLSEIQRFCKLCDRYGFQALHAITPIGSNLWDVDCQWDNERIRRETGNRLFLDNGPVLDYLLGRRKKDLFAVHGLWHTHELLADEIEAAWTILWTGDFIVTHQVPPFNETGSYPNPVPDLYLSGPEAPRLEEYLDRPGDLVPHLLADGSIDATLHSAVIPEIVYLHSWRFERGPFTWEQLDRCLAALSTRLSSSAATAR